MNIAIIGAGYVGLVSGACLAKIGHIVVCADKNADKIAQLKTGQIPIYEPGLEEMLAEVVADGRLSFTVEVVAATRSAEAVIIAVGTPPAADGVSSNLSHVIAAAKEIANGIDDFKVIIVKSTVPAGTVRKLGDHIRQGNPGSDFEMAANPEFLRQGAAVFDFMNPDRIVIGTETSRARAVLDKIYAPFVERNHVIVHTGLESAELIKFASNGFLATKIAFINEISELCEKTGASIHEVARGMGLDNRIGPKFLEAGPGFGGSCFPKDLRALARLGRNSGAGLHIMEAAIISNEGAKLRMVQKIEDLAGGDLSGLTIAIFGVTFKPDTDDMREAPSLTILPRLAANGATLRLVDPQGQYKGAALLPKAQWFDDPYEAAEGTNMIVVLTEWREFRDLDLARLCKLMATPAVADLRNIYSPEALRAAGFSKFCHVGRRM